MVDNNHLPVHNNHLPVHNIDKLRGAENYTTWKVEMKSCLNRDGCWKVVCGREIKKSTVPSSVSSSASPLSSLSSSASSSAATTDGSTVAAVSAAAADSSFAAATPSSPTSKKITVLDDDTYDERNESAYDTIVLGLDSLLLRHIAHCPDDGKSAWEVFERLYDASHAQKPTRLSLRRQLYKSPMDPRETMRDFINRKVAISEKLLDLGTLVDESELADCILMDVTEEYQGIVVVLERRGGYGLSDVKGALIQEETEKRQRNATATPKATTRTISPEHMEAIKREQAPAAAPLPQAPMQKAKKPLLGMGADHPPAVAMPPSPAALTSAPPVRTGNVPIAIARNRSTKRPHHDSGDEDVSGPMPTPDGKKRSTEDREDNKKPKISARNGNRKSKAPQPLRRETLPPSSSPATSKAVVSTQDRPFTCLFTFASCTQTFSSKNEWKRHINHIHLQLWYWRCDYATCANRKAFFNRKDLFGQHLKRMHAPSNSNEIQERCKKERRKPPEKSTCGFCERVFEGPGGWEACVDHIGEHYTNGAKGSDWKDDKDFVDWAVKEGVVQKGEGGALVQDPRAFPIES